VFRLPHFPHELFQHEIPIPPTLHEIVNNKSQRSAPSSGRRGKDLPAPLRAYPSLSSLSSREITDDLDYLLNHRWPPEPPPSRYDSFAPPAPPAMGVVLDMSPYGRPPAPGPTPRRRYPPGPSGLQHELDHGSGPFSRPLTPHGAKVNGWMPNSGTSRPGEPMFERDERDREEIELREREMEYLLHKQQREQQQREQQQQQQQMHYIIQQPQQQLHTPTRSIPHSRSDPHIGPGQGPQLPPPPTQHSSSGHHHHHVHYHHVHHHHHSSSSAPPPSLPQPPISPLHPYDGPRHASSRDLEPPRVSVPEIINLPSAPSAPLPPRQWEREREREPPSPRHRERERDRDRDREREQRDRDRDRDNRDRGRPASGPPPAGPHERIMTPFSAPLAPSAQRPPRGSHSESVQPQPQPPPPPPPRTPQQGGGTPHGSPVRTRALPGSMVPAPPSAQQQPPPQQQPTTPQLLLAAHPMQGQGTMSPPRAPRIPGTATATLPPSPSAKPMDGERDRIVLPPPPPPPPQQQQQPPISGPGIRPAGPTPPLAHAHVPHRLPLPPRLPSPIQGQGTGQSQPPPPPSVPVVAGEGV
jgi:hypothetical protein